MESLHDDVAQSDESIRAAYDEVATTYASLIRGTDPEDPVDLAMLAHFVRALPAEPVVLDAGCGTGRMMPVLARLAGPGCQVEGIDLSDSMVRRAGRDHPGFSLSVGSLRTLPYAGGVFDGVLSWYSTIHSGDADLRGMMGEMRRVLRPGGLLLLAFQSGHGTVDASGAYRNLGHDVELRRRLRTADEMSALMDGAGIDEVARLVRAPVGVERDPQAIIVGTRT